MRSSRLKTVEIFGYLDWFINFEKTIKKTQWWLAFDTRNKIWKLPQSRRTIESIFLNGERRTLKKRTESSIDEFYSKMLHVRKGSCWRNDYRHYMPLINKYVWKLSKFDRNGWCHETENYWYEEYYLESTPDIGMMVRVFANGPGDLGPIPGWVIPKTQKWYLMPPCLTLSNIR